MKFLILASILIVSMIGIVGVQESFAVPPLERIPVFNIIVSGIDGSTTIKSNEQATLIVEYVEKYPNLDYVIIFQIKNELGQVVLLNWIEGTPKKIIEPANSYQCGYKRCNYDEWLAYESYVCGDKICPAEIPDSKFIETSWLPSESGNYEIQIFTWEEIDNPTALSPPISRTISVK